MSKKARRATHSPASRRFPWPWLALAGALLLIVGGLLAWTSSRQGSPAQAPAEVAGAPKLAVDRTQVDEGYLKFDTQVRTTFRLSNVGDQPLQILGQPQVELVEGC